MERKKAPIEPHVPAEESRFGRTNWLLLAVGLALLVVGFVILALADERAANFAGRLSPFLIVGAYATMFVGLIYRSGDGRNLKQSTEKNPPT